MRGAGFHLHPNGLRGQWGELEQPRWQDPRLGCSPGRGGSARGPGQGVPSDGSAHVCVSPAGERAGGTPRPPLQSNTSYRRGGSGQGGRGDVRGVQGTLTEHRTVSNGCAHYIFATPSTRPPTGSAHADAATAARACARVAMCERSVCAHSFRQKTPMVDEGREPSKADRSRVSNEHVFLLICRGRARALTTKRSRSIVNHVPWIRHCSHMQ